MIIIINLNKQAARLDMPMQIAVQAKVTLRRAVSQDALYYRYAVAQDEIDPLIDALDNSSSSASVSSAS